MADLRTVRVGDRDITVAKLSTFKALRASEMLADLLEVVPGLIDEANSYAKETQEKNTIRVTRAMVRNPAFRDAYGVVEEDFPDGEDVLELPGAAPPTQEVIAAVAPKLMRTVPHQLVALVALVLAPNSELEEADETDGVDEYLRLASRKLRHQADADQLVDAATAVIEVVRGQFSGTGVDLGKLAGALGVQTGPSPEEEKTSPNRASRRRRSSTRSPEPTAGLGNGSSTGSPSPEPSPSTS